MRAFIPSQCCNIFIVAFSLFSHFIGPIEVSANFLIKGTKIACFEEGKAIDVPFLKDSCISCICKNSVIDCFEHTCPESHNCYYQLPQNSTSCCAKCKGCFLNGKYLQNGDTYHEVTDVCGANHCNSGTLTRHRVQCHAPCEHPISLLGQCCPSCETCPTKNGQDGGSGTMSSAETDPCVQCYCFKGQLICTRKVCPTLPCPKTDWFKSADSCCPVCKGRKTWQLRSQSCLINGRVYQDQAQFKYDECTSCKCQNGTNICQRKTCSPLQCEKSKQIKMDGQCCPVCLYSPIKQMYASCLYRNRVYKDKEMWSDSCRRCSCQDGKVHCSTRQCASTPVCPSGYRKEKPSSSCCEKCVQVDATCLVTDQMRTVATFDGKRYHLEGRCNYVLSRDCENKSFSIHLVSKYRNTSYSSGALIQDFSLMVRIESTKIYLSHFGRVRVNRSLVQLPFVQMNTFSISRLANRTKLRSSLGFEIIWTTNMSAEIKVKSKYHSKMCGLCGNFNLDPSDEFRLKNSKRITSREKFVNSFAVGSNLLCPKRKAFPRQSVATPASVATLSLARNSSTRACHHILALCGHCTKRKTAHAAYNRCIRQRNVFSSRPQSSAPVEL